MNVIAIFDIGKTNKKFFLFNEQYKIVFERTVQFAEIQDEDGFTCDDVHQLSAWVSEMITEAMGLNQFNIKAFNFSAYGASFVHINSKGEPVTPLYNYLKPFPAQLKELSYLWW
jgi:L-fuculokinase